MGYNTYKIADLIDEIAMGPFGSNIKVECFVDDGVPVLNGSNVAGFALSERDFRYVTPEKATSLKKANASRGDVVITHRGTLGQIVYIPATSKYDQYVISQSQFRVRCNEKIMPEYMVYYFHTPLGQHKLLSNASQVGVPALARPSSTFQQIEIDIPSVETQQKVVTILNAIQDKIDCNNKINDNLQQQADAIFAELFLSGVDRSVLTVADVSIKVTDGVHNTVKDDPSGEYYLLSCKNIKGGLLSIGDSERRISKETFEKLRKRTRLEKGDILLSSVGTVGELLLLKEIPSNYEFQRSVAMIKPNPAFVSSEYLYQALRSKKNEIIHAAHGAVQQCLFISDISDFQIPVPTKSELEKFDSLVVPMFSKIQSNESENKRLVALRDILLPKLMAGEIDVSSVRI